MILWVFDWLEASIIETLRELIITVLAIRRRIVAVGQLVVVVLLHFDV